MKADDEYAVRLDRVTKTFGAQRVLDALSLEVPYGAGVCILGRSGTGKSVLLKHIIGLMRPDEGRVYVTGEDITHMSSRELSRIRPRLGFLFQNAALFDSLTVGENVALPLRRHTDLGEEEIRRRVIEKLDQVGLAQDVDKMPAALSGGMRKRAGLARAMALDPPILLVDEPSAGLDPITAAEIDDLLLGLKRNSGTTLLVVTHNMPSARVLGDELVFLHGGRILARGTAEELESSEHEMVRTFLRSEGSG
ncbi:MAG TPA: ATP-binding cassette domain-containing protein [Vicinamibacterales bacterium]